MAILIFLIDGHYIQIAAKVPIFEHFPTLHLSTFRCTSHNLEHFLGYRSVFCLQSRLTSCTFWVLLNTFGRRLIQSTPGYIQRAEESTHLWTLPQYYKITQDATTCCTSLNFEHFLFRIATSRCTLSHILHFSGTFEHFRQESDPEYPMIHPESWRKYPPLNTFHLSGSAFTATRMFRASFHS